MTHVCAECFPAFGFQRGMTIYRSRAHADTFRVEDLPVPGQKAQGGVEELNMLAKPELDEERNATEVRKSFNQRLLVNHPGRSFEYI